MDIKPLYLLLLALVGGTLMGISFPHTGGLFPLAFVAFVPLILINLELNKKKGARFFKRFGYNYLYFVIFNLITTWWIYNASEGGMYMAVFCNSLLMTLPFFFFGFIARQLGENKGLLALVVLWIGFEYCHYFWELSWPWLSFGHIFGEYPWLIQWYEYSGVTGGTLWVLMVNIGVYFIIRNVKIRKEALRIQAPVFLFIGLVILVPVLSSVLIYTSYEEEVDPVNMVIIQPNLDPYSEKFTMPLPDQLDIIFDLAEEKVDENTDLVVCPETAISRTVNEDYLEQEPNMILIKEWLRAHHNVNMLIGADSRKYFQEENSLASNYIESINAYVENYNAAFLIDPNRPTQIYHKAKPVLGAEKVPFLSWFPSLKEYSIELGGTSGMIGLGEEAINMTLGDLSFAPLICYESVYGDYVSYFTGHGADILCVVTNDGWWGDTPGYRQHRMFSQIRAIENRRSVARSANTGISCFIDQKGDIISELGWDERGALQEILNRNTEITFFVRYGDVLGRVSLFLIIALFVYALTSYAKTTGLADKAHLTRK
ncbi:MAG: apolipoprotein N-acyltransferase [Crocinitomix sp.]|nr:apolipoprotein N-acyltransferase [Crocinitomix sp.]